MANTHFSGPVNSKAGFIDSGTSNSTINRLVIGNDASKVASATAGAATLNTPSGVVTSESITTAAGSDYALTITNSVIAATDIVLASVQTGSNTTAGLAVHEVTPASGSVVIKVRNAHASAALNGTIKVSFVVVKV